MNMEDLKLAIETLTPDFKFEQILLQFFHFKSTTLRSNLYGGTYWRGNLTMISNSFNAMGIRLNGNINGK